MSKSQISLILLRALLNTAKRADMPYYLSHRPHGDSWPVARDKPGNGALGLRLVFRENRSLYFQVAQCVFPDRMETLLFASNSQRYSAALMVNLKFYCWLVALLFGMGIFAPTVSAAIVQTGNVSPNVSSWSQHTSGIIGGSSDGSVTVDQGSTLTSGSGMLGGSPDVTGIATISGNGSKWTMDVFSLKVGASGHGLLTIQDGGEVIDKSGFWLSVAAFPGSTGTVTVTGSGSKLTTTRNFLIIGEQGNGTLTIEDGGSITSQGASLGSGYYNSSITGTGVVTITGAGSQWTTSRFRVGTIGYGELNVLAEGQLNSTELILGEGPDAPGVVTVSGSGSKITNRGTLHVGDRGTGLLTVTEGGEVVTSELLASHTDLFGNGTITVTGGGVLDGEFVFDAIHGNQTTSSFGDGGILTLTAGGGILGAGFRDVGSMRVADGVAITSREATLGYHYGASGHATVTGAGSKLTSYGAFYVGRDGSGTLTVADGGVVETGTLYASLSDLSGNGTITATKGGTVDADLVFDAVHGNQATATFGSGGILTLQANGNILGVGYKQSGSLTISDGMSITSSTGYLGYRVGSTGLGLVRGPGSKWSNSSTLDVGRSGIGSLTIEEGGQVSNTIGYIGRYSNSMGSTTVTGVGSKWTNNDAIYVGNSGSGSLTIAKGGQVSGIGGYLGFNAGSTGTASVEGFGSHWTGGALFVGYEGNGSLIITHGGLVSVYETLTIDHNLDNDSFINMATGGMLALYGDADDSLSQFFNLISGTDAIRYWDATVEDWAPLTSATLGTEYTLEYFTTGELAGYTLLTVGRAGDFDNDGDVDGRDFLAAQRNPELGSFADWQNAYNNEGLVSALHLPPSALNVPIPEPSTWILAMALVVGIVHRHRL